MRFYDYISFMSEQVEISLFCTQHFLIYCSHSIFGLVNNVWVTFINSSCTVNAAMFSFVIHTGFVGKQQPQNLH